jgi:hypothetical protein
MKSKIIALLVSISLLAFVCLLLPLSAASAQGGCSSVGAISPINQFFNVRSTPGNTTQTPIATVVRGTSVPVTGSTVASGSVWWRLCQGGWVAESVSWLTLFTPTPTPTITRTATPSRTPVVQAPTPTRIVTTPTVAEAVAVTINGVTYICDLPCSFRIEKP